MSVWIRSCGCAGWRRSASSPRSSSWRRGWNSTFPSSPASPSSAFRRCSISRCRSPSTRCSGWSRSMRRRCSRSTSSNWPRCCSSPAACRTRSRSCSSRPVLISATALPIRLTIALGLLAVACASALVFFHLPLPWDSDDPLVLPPIYLFGVWLSIVLAIGVTSLYAFQVDRGGAQAFRRAGRDRTGADARAASDPARRPCRRRRA